ncbi:MAG TPA: cytochrome c [Deinococcales bacterium]|nr:cytochrome c [Deinococcales bacterium]
MSNPKKRAILSLLLLTAAVLTVGLSLSFAQENGDDADEAASEGAVLYQSFCAACHMTDGSGAEGAGTYPNLADNNAVEASADFVITRILDGYGAMPPFAGSLDDAEVAAIVNHVRGTLNDSDETIEADLPESLR